MAHTNQLISLTLGTLLIEYLIISCFNYKDIAIIMHLPTNLIKYSNLTMKAHYYLRDI